MNKEIRKMNCKVKKMCRDFYLVDALDLAEKLLGKILVFKNKRYRIVEVEAYRGIEDKASHTYGNRRTKRTEAMYLEGGHVYIYLIYGMYYNLNVVANVKDRSEERRVGKECRSWWAPEH